jgi:rubredoxin
MKEVGELRTLGLSEIELKSTVADLLWNWKLLPFGNRFEMIRLKELCPTCSASALDFCRIQQHGMRLAWVRCANCHYREERTLKNQKIVNTTAVWELGFSFLSGMPKKVRMLYQINT